MRGISFCGAHSTDILPQKKFRRCLPRNVVSCRCRGVVYVERRGHTDCIVMLYLKCCIDWFVYACVGIPRFVSWYYNDAGVVLYLCFIITAVLVVPSMWGKKQNKKNIKMAEFYSMHLAYCRLLPYANKLVSFWALQLLMLWNSTTIPKHQYCWE